MAKEAENNEEVIAKIKAEEEAKKAAAEEAAKQEAEEAARIKAQQEEIAGSDPELTDEQKAEAEKIAAAERDENDIPIPESQPKPKPGPSADDSRSEERYTKSKTAGEKLKLIAMSYPLTTPDAHIIFGFGGYRYTLGDLRDLTGIR